MTIKYLATGVVTQKGANVTNLKIGSRIAIENHFFCGSCYSCDVSKKFFKYPGIKYSTVSMRFYFTEWPWRYLQSNESIWTW